MMNPQDQNAAQPMGDPNIRNPLEVMQPNEHIIFEIKRHPIGIITTYGAAGFIMILLAVLAFGVVPSLASGDSRSQALTIGAVGFIIVAFVALVFVFVANTVYWGNSWILTSDSITQVSQTSLFNKQSSQLSLSNLEDVTAEKNGILCQMFNYGVIKAETAGERSKFMFLYCPNPTFYAQKVLQARELFEQAGRYQSETYQQGHPAPGSTQFTGNPTANYPEQNADNPGGVNTNSEG